MQHLPPRFLTANLHDCAAHLPRQAELLGPPGLLTDFWVERRLQPLKRLVRNRISRQPERLMVTSLLTRLAISRSAASGVRFSFDEAVPAYRAKPLSGPQFDTGCAVTGWLLLQRGQLLSGIGRRLDTAADARRRRDNALRVCKQFVAAYQPAGFSDAASVAAARIYEHRQATRGGREVVSSTSNSSQTRSVGYYINVTFEDSGQLVGRVAHFLRVEPPTPADGEQPAEPLRLAVCHFFNRQAPRDGVQRVNCSRVQGGDGDGGLRAVHVSSIDCVLLSAGSGDWLRLTPFDNCSRQ